MHTQSLAKVERKGVHRSLHYSDVVEQRVSNLVQAGITAVTLTNALLFVLGTIPISVLDGLFLFIGFSSLQGNQIAERGMFVVTEYRNRVSVCPHVFATRVSFPEIFWFTLLQAVLVFGIFGITLSPAAISFPLFILVLIPLRFYLLPRFFKQESLELLDAEHISAAPEDGSRDQVSSGGVPVLEDVPTLEMQEVVSLEASGTPEHDSESKNARDDVEVDSPGKSGAVYPEPDSEARIKKDL